MEWYHHIAWVLILSQLIFLVQAYRNYCYALSKYKKNRSWYRPKTVLIVPCKGEDLNFERNITSFFNQDYENYLLWFVVADESDPAYEPLCKLKNQLSQHSKAQDVQVLIADRAKRPIDSAENQKTETPSCSRKIQNLLYCYERITDDIEVLAFADSDINVQSNWLSHIVYPLRQSKNGAASGYRWFIPKKNNLATLALSATNAKVAQLLGNTLFNQAWGGSMAIRVDVFRKVGLDKIWPKALSDDLSLSYAVKRAGMKVAFVPACLVASYEATTFKELFEFGRRQFLITRIFAPGTWWFGFCVNLYSILGLWGGAGLAFYAAMTKVENLPLFAAVPICFFASQMGRAILRQKMIGQLLKSDYQKMRPAMAADILFSWLWSLLMASFIVSSAFGRTICWRGIHYKLLGPLETITLGEKVSNGKNL